MDEMVKLLDKNLEYVDHEIEDGVMYIHVISNRNDATCPYCGRISRRVHSKYERRFRDLPMQGKKVEIIINNRKMFCDNANCEHKTFAESFDCLPFKGKRSQRLTDEIVNLSLSVSSMAAAEILKKSTADVGKSTICSLLKKRRTNN